MLSTLAEAAHTFWMRSRLWFAALFIGGYLSVLGGGLFCHTFGWNAASHPAMYFIVWDMFCGWSGYEARYHVLAEGVSGDFYQVLPGPWGEYVPYGNLGRRHYDVDGVNSTRMAMNVLRHTDHEPIARVFIVEETWAKKYNMPDEQWAMRWDQPKDPYHYFTPRHVMTADGQLLQTFGCFYAQNNHRAIYANPRLEKEMSRAQPFYMVDQRSDAFGLSNVLANSTAIRGGSPLGR